MTFPYPDRPSVRCENIIEDKHGYLTRCGNKASERHHCFSQTKYAKKVYGKLIHHPINIRNYCYSCHHGKGIEKWDEAQFRAAMKAGGIDLPPVPKPSGKCRREEL